MEAYNKTGSVRYYVTTDTHGYPWGFRHGVNGKTIHFDLGDNTAGCNLGDHDAEPETMALATEIALYGNHATTVLGNDAEKGLLKYIDTANKIIFYGLDTGGNEISEVKIRRDQVADMAEELAGLSGSWDVVVLTHFPLFPCKNTAENSNWDCGYVWDKGKTEVDGYAQELFTLLHAFQAHSASVAFITNKGVRCTFESTNGHVIGCFCGHIHAHVKCTYQNIPMESFSTNGSDEWSYNTEHGHANMGTYVPYENYININFQSMTVNGNSFQSPTAGYFQRYDSYHDAANCYYLDKAVGPFKMRESGVNHPKFYAGTYIGYTNSPLNGTVFGSNKWDNRYWPFGTTVTLTVGSSRVSARVIWFDTNGRLRYYSNDTDFNNDVSDKEYWKAKKYTEIDQYKTARVTFKANNVTWTFQNGLLVSAVPTYCAGSLAGKNGYAIEFNANGVPTGISRNGSAGQDYGTGQNYVNYKDVKVYQGSELIHITQVPQIGITGRFTSSSKIDLARADSNGANRITSPDNLLLRVVDVNDAVWWLYDGKLTTLTDQQVL